MCNPQALSGSFSCPDSWGHLEGWGRRAGGREGPGTCISPGSPDDSVVGARLWSTLLSYSDFPSHASSVVYFTFIYDALGDQGQPLHAIEPLRVPSPPAPHAHCSLCREGCLKLYEDLLSGESKTWLWKGLGSGPHSLLQALGHLSVVPTRRPHAL